MTRFFSTIYKKKSEEEKTNLYYTVYFVEHSVQ